MSFGYIYPVELR